MQSIHPLRKARVAGFGRGRRFLLDLPAVPNAAWVDDLKLFTATFAAGFLFVAIYLS